MLLPNWREVLTRAWSMRLLALSIVLGAVDLALPYLEGLLPIPRGTFVMVVLVTNVAAAVARLISQGHGRPDPDDEHDGVGA